MVRQHGRYRHTTNKVITFTSGNKIQYMILSVSAPLHMFNEIDWPEYFRQTLDICILLEIPVNTEISKDQQMPIAGGKTVKKLKKSPAFKPFFLVGSSR